MNEVTTDRHTNTVLNILSLTLIPEYLRIETELFLKHIIQLILKALGDYYVV